MTYSQINPTKVGGFLLLTVLILISGCDNVNIEGKVQCGYLAHCPENYTTRFIGGQCLICYKEQNNTNNFTFDIQDICENYYMEVSGNSSHD